MSTSNCNIIHLSKVSSTNNYAKELISREQPSEGTIITASHQSAGKGHDNNSWESEAGENLLMSLILYPHFLDITRQFNLSMAVALGITDFLKELIPEQQIYIKWPNDIYVADKKIGGILINNEIMGDHFEHVIVGIGLNVNQKVFSNNLPNPVSLNNLTGTHYSLEDVTSKLSKDVMARYGQLRQGSIELIKSEYHSSLLGISEWRRFIYKGKEIKGMIRDVNEFGHLIVETSAGEIECEMKELVFPF